jgi:hypothetical protein
MRRYGAAAFAASILRHMGWDLSLITASIKSSGSALGGRQRGQALLGQAKENGSRLYEEIGDRASLFSVIVRRDMTYALGRKRRQQPEEMDGTFEPLASMRARKEKEPRILDAQPQVTRRAPRFAPSNDSAFLRPRENRPPDEDDRSGDLDAEKGVKQHR